MTGLAAALLVGAAIFAAADWAAVWRGTERLRPVTKPAVMVLLTGLALTLHPGGGLGGVRAAVVAAALLSLVGDVLLLPQVDVFEGGLAAFLAAHIAYIVACSMVGLDPPLLAPLAALVLLGAMTPVLLRIARSVRRDEPALLPPVLVYVAVICAMAGAAVATREPLAILGALVFVASDAQLAWNRFVVGGDGDRRLDLGCIVTYHVAQALLILALVPEVADAAVRLSSSA